MRDKIINGKKYLLISDLAKASGINVRTIHRWISHGDLVNHLTVYQSESKNLFVRFALPDPDDKLVQGETFKYQLPKENK